MIQILNGIKGCYQDYYYVIYINDVIEVVVKLFDCYIQDCFLLDKVIDFLDEVGLCKNLILKIVDLYIIENEIYIVEVYK